MSGLDPAARHLLARDRIDRFRAEADADRLAGGGAGRARGRVASWEGRPASRPPSDRIRAVAGRLRAMGPMAQDGEPAPR